MVTWEFYFARRKVTNFRNWALQHDIHDYAKLVKVLESIGTTIPTILNARIFLPEENVSNQPVHSLENHPVQPELSHAKSQNIKKISTQKSKS